MSQSFSPSQQLLIAAAWVDGVLDPSEAQLLRQLLGDSPTLAQALQQPVDIEAVLAQIPDGAARLDTMRDVLKTVFADDILEIEEFDLIERVAQRLGIDGEPLENLRREVT